MTVRVAAIVSVVILSAMFIAGCGRSSSTQPPTAIKRVPGEPTIRVRLDEAAAEVTFNGPTKIVIRAAERDARRQLLDTPVTIRRSGNAWIGPWNEGQPGRFETLLVEPVGPSPLYLGSTAYPGTMQLVPVTHEGERATGRAPSLAAPDAFDVVSHVGIETYLPGVLERELYANFQPATYLSQAIVARSYAIARIMERGGSSHFDVESSTASQVYGGQSTRPLARRAAADTAGLVLTWNDRIITAYYSSTCGGFRQSPADAFGGLNPYPPLEPKNTHSWCAISPRFEWGPIERDRGDLSRRIAAWGERHEVAVRQIGTLSDIRVAGANQVGRPTRFRLADVHGRVFELRADSLRHAANYHDADRGLPPVGGEELIRSGHFDIAVRGERVAFTNGRGFGHGVGYCQFGAEGMAREGWTPVEILAEAYPGARVQKAY